MGVDTQGDPKRSSKSKIREFEVPRFIDQEILWFEVPMKDPACMTVLDSLDELVEVLLQARSDFQCKVQRG